MNGPETLTAPRCVRCADEVLVPLQQVGDDVQFFECRNCARQYARKRDGALTYRWGHPVSVALYNFCFRSGTAEDLALFTATSLRTGRTPDELEAFVREVELELRAPTQNVRDMLETGQSEPECRAFIERVVAIIRTPTGDE